MNHFRELLEASIASLQFETYFGRKPVAGNIVSTKVPSYKHSKVIESTAICNNFLLRVLSQSKFVYHSFNLHQYFLLCKRKMPNNNVVQNHSTSIVLQFYSTAVVVLVGKTLQWLDQAFINAKLLVSCRNTLFASYITGWTNVLCLYLGSPGPERSILLKKVRKDYRKTCWKPVGL